MQRIVRFFRHEPVGGYGVGDGRGLQRNLDVVEAAFFQHAHVGERAFHERFRGGAAVAFEQILFHGAAVHADAYDGTVGLRRGGKVVHGTFPADVARIDAQASETRIKSGEGQTMIKMDVGHERHGRAVGNGLQRCRRLFIRNGKAHDFASCGVESRNLFQRGRRVSRIGVGHALYCDGSAAADEHVAESELSGSVSVRGVHAFSLRLRRWCSASQV